MVGTMVIIKQTLIQRIDKYMPMKLHWVLIRDFTTIKSHKLISSYKGKIFKSCSNFIYFCFYYILFIL
ncbi:unnamed protein product [Paramecium sonneborni]|uniref:Uncharacterized protein n=1 Tax=Paramecium sonneborni TaxID=65129 RepID=A0A8S1Q384_9CILI|nr:unnamed protein product [Paramecium sonneborni]